MPKTIQIRDLDDDVYTELARLAAAEGLSVPALLRREACRLVSRPSAEDSRAAMLEWLERTRRGTPSKTTTRDVLETLDEIRGPWPVAGH